MIAGLLNRINPVPILVVGDLILDTYTIGKVKRISPEAPVGVVHVISEEVKPGGACNVALNLISLGSSVQLVGRIGKDLAGQQLLNKLKAEGVDVSAILCESDHKTPHKNRVIADNQQIIRIDHEDVTQLSSALEEQFLSMVPELIQGKRAVAISDYGKGFLSKRLLRAIIDEAKNQNVPVIVDPKGTDFNRYSGATLIKPNQSEAYNAANMSSTATLEDVARAIMEKCHIEQLMITRSQHGITIFDRDGLREDYPVQVREIKDVTGAGDTVLAMVSCAVANELSLGEASQLANAAAGIAIEFIGCARVTLAQLAKKLLAENAGNKIFDDAHLYALKQALQETKYILIDVGQDCGIQPKAYRAIAALRNDGYSIILCLNDMDPDTLHMLAGLQHIDFIIQKGESLTNLLAVLNPEKIYTSTPEGILPAAELAIN